MRSAKPWNPPCRKPCPGLSSGFPIPGIERWVRAVKDALADLNDWGRLAYILEGRDLPELALLLAWRPGFYPYLLPELEPAFWELQGPGIGALSSRPGRRL